MDGILCIFICNTQFIDQESGSNEHWLKGKKELDLLYWNLKFQLFYSNHNFYHLYHFLQNPKPGSV